MVWTLRGSQQRLQVQQGVAAHGRQGHQAQPTTRGRFKHPCRYFYGSAILLVLETAPTHRLPMSERNSTALTASNPAHHATSSGEVDGPRAAPHRFWRRTGGRRSARVDASASNLGCHPRRLSAAMGRSHADAAADLRKRRQATNGRGGGSRADREARCLMRGGESVPAGWARSHNPCRIQIELITCRYPPAAARQPGSTVFRSGP